MTPTSATAFPETGLVYSDSNSEYPASWIQAPISRLTFLQGRLVNGLYVRVGPTCETLITTDDMAYEFAAWEAASDEALLNFEKENL